MNTPALITNTPADDRLARRREQDRKRREANKKVPIYGTPDSKCARPSRVAGAPAIIKPDTNVLTAKAVLADLTIGSWSVRKFDRQVSEEVDTIHNTIKAGRFNKKLLNSELRSAISHVSQQARETHRRMTKPWLDEGCRILPTALFVQHANAMKDLRLKHEAAREEFFKAYPTLVEKRKEELKKLFNAEDYPPIEIVKQKFHFEVRLLPIPTASDFRVKLAQDQLDKARADLEENMKGVLSDAMKDTRTQIVDVVGTMAKKLKDYKPAATDMATKGIFHQSLVDNVRELVELLPAFNLTEDPAMTRVIARMQKELCNEEAKELRDNDDVRKVVQKSAEEILADVSNFMM